MARVYSSINRIGEKIGTFIIIEKTFCASKKPSKFKFKCINCNFETNTTIDGKRRKPGCKNCIIQKAKCWIGEKIGPFIVIEKVSCPSKKYSYTYKFKCTECNIETCGAIQKKLHKKACKNCIMQKSIRNSIIIGQKYNKWTVIRIDTSNRVGTISFLCECDCGRRSVVQPRSLIRGYSKGCISCGVITGWKTIKERKTKPKLTKYNNPYLNYCITPRTMDDIIEHFGLSLEEIQDILMDLMLEEKIEQNKELLWETK